MPALSAEELEKMNSEIQETKELLVPTKEEVRSLQARKLIMLFTCYLLELATLQNSMTTPELIARISELTSEVSFSFLLRKAAE